MSAIKEEMPVLARHEGIWGGTYTVLDREGQILDQYNSRVTCQFPEDKPYPYFQTNLYEWPDGQQKEYQFPGTYRDKKLWFETERVNGYAWEVDDSTIIFQFKTQIMPEIDNHEIIFISPCNNYKHRTWHWFQNHQLYRVILMREERIG